MHAGVLHTPSRVRGKKPTPALPSIWSQRRPAELLAWSSGSSLGFTFHAVQSLMRLQNGHEAAAAIHGEGIYINDQKEFTSRKNAQCCSVADRLQRFFKNKWEIEEKSRKHKNNEHGRKRRWWRALQSRWNTVVWDVTLKWPPSMCTPLHNMTTNF